MGKGKIVGALTFLNDKRFLTANKIPTKTDELIARDHQNFINQVDNQFAVIAKKNAISETEYQSRKNAFLNSADAKIIIYTRNYKIDHPDVEISVISEETRGSNDSKLFKKIPAICGILGIPVITLPEFLETTGNWGLSTD